MDATPRTILIVEDDPAHAELLRRSFEPHAERFETVVAGSLATARASIDDHRPDLVVVDNMLPDGKGIELLADPRGPLPCPLILMTSYGNEQVAVEALKAGAMDYVVKSPTALGDMPRVAGRALREWDLVEERRRAEEAKGRLLVRIQRQNATLVSLSSHPALGEGRSQEAMEAVAAEAGRCLELDLLHICRLDPDRGLMRCQVAWSVRSGIGRSELELDLEHHPAFAHALEGGRVIEAVDVCADPRTAALSELCWTPLGIVSTLIAPVRLRGRMIGVTCFAQVARARHWELDEVAFAGQVADLVAQVVSSADLHRRAEELAAITRAAREVTAGPALTGVLESIARHAAELSNSDASGVFSFRDDGRLYVDASYGVSGAFVGAVNRAGVPLGHGAIGQAAVAHDPVAIADTVTEPGYEYLALAASEDIRAVVAVPMLRGDEMIGGIVVWHRQPRRFEPAEVAFLRALAQQCVNAVENARLFDSVQAANAELARAYDTTLEGWGRALELRDQETEGHTRRVADKAVRLARAIGLPQSDLVHVRRGALLHDIGKMAIPDALLLKPGKLDETEMQIMRRHTEYARQLLSPIEFLAPVLEIPCCHHERWDGSGYPQGLAGEEIPLTARVFAVIDVWDALTSDRPYRPAWSRERARHYIRDESGRAFDPRVVREFEALLARGEL